MFTVLEVHQEKVRGIGKLLWRLCPPEPELCKIPVKGGAPYFVLKVRTGEKEPPWEDILYLVGRCASRILTVGEIVLPEKSAVRRFVPEHLPLIGAMHTMADVLSASQVPPQKVILGVYDPVGALCGRGEALVRCAADVRICTKKIREYDAESTRLMTLCGGGLTVGETTELFRGCNILLCINADILPTEQKLTFAVYGETAENLFLCREIRVPEPYCAQVPDGVESLLFFSALYELCGVRALDCARFDIIQHKGESMDLSEVAERLAVGKRSRDFS